MERFETILMKLGEHGIQSILEDWERFVGIRSAHTLTLEERWEQFLRATEPSAAFVA